MGAKRTLPVMPMVTSVARAETVIRAKASVTLPRPSIALRPDITPSKPRMPARMYRLCGRKRDHGMCGEATGIGKQHRTIITTIHTGTDYRTEEALCYPLIMCRQ